MKLGAIIIMNVFTRKEEGMYLKKVIEISAKPLGIPVYISYDDGSWGLWKNYSNALTMDIPESTHRMVIHDDIVMDRNVLEKILYIMERAPQDKIVSFYNPTNKDYQTCYSEGRHVLSTDTNFWLPACVYPNHIAKEFIGFIDKKAKKENTYDDTRLKAYLQYHKSKLYAVVPSLTQHIGAFRSNFKQGGMINGIVRYSLQYDNQIDVEGIDWEEEFKNPYKSKMNSDRTKLVIKQEFLSNKNNKL